MNNMNDKPANRMSRAVGALRSRTHKYALRLTATPTVVPSKRDGWIQ